MATSGHSFDDAVLQVSSDGGTTYNAISEVTDFDPGFDMDTIDMTNIDSGKHAERIAGTRDATPSLTANYIPTDTGQGAIRDAYLNQNTVKLRYRPKGTNTGDEQFVITVFVTSFGPSGSQGGKVELSADFEASEAATRSTQ